MLAINKTKIIDIRNHSRSPKYLSRLIWQVLFNEYVEIVKKTDDLDSLLCDLYTLERELQNHRELQQHHQPKQPLYWVLNNNNPLTSWIYNFQDFSQDHCYRIEEATDSLLITKVH